MNVMVKGVGNVEGTLTDHNRMVTCTRCQRDYER